jgi:hypothetical protein
LSKLGGTVAQQQQQAQQQAQQQQALVAHQALNLQLLAMLSPQEQGLVMQMPAAQRPQAIVQLVQLLHSQLLHSQLLH